MLLHPRNWDKYIWFSPRETLPDALPLDLIQSDECTWVTGEYDRLAQVIDAWAAFPSASPALMHLSIAGVVAVIQRWIETTGTSYKVM